jgi:hypothetical protein
VGVRSLGASTASADLNQGDEGDNRDGEAALHDGVWSH